MPKSINFLFYQKTVNFFWWKLARIGTRYTFLHSSSPPGCTGVYVPEKLSLLWWRSPIPLKSLYSSDPLLPSYVHSKLQICNFLGVINVPYCPSYKYTIDKKRTRTIWVTLNFSSTPMVWRNISIALRLLTALILAERNLMNHLRIFYFTRYHFQPSHF